MYNIPDTKYILIIKNNQGFFSLAKNLELYQANKYITVKYYYIRGKCKHNYIILYYIPITKIIADSLTKILRK
jgi:hypothetical protein